MKNIRQKKLSFAILEILRSYTDPEHTLNQNDIGEILVKDYGIHADRKSIKRNLTALWEMGFPIDFQETRRMYPNKEGVMEESFIQHDFYMERDFTDAELRLLIDSLLFSKHIPYSQCKALVKKLEGLSNRYFQSRVRFISSLPDTKPNNTQLFYTIEILDEAIAGKKQVAFIYNRYGLDKKLHPRRNEAYIVNPYQMVATNGRYYLIGNYHKYQNLAYYRLDRISQIRLLDTPAKPIRQVEGMEQGLQLPRHMAEHIYMFTGKSEVVTFRAKKYILNDIMDWFNGEITFFDETEEEFSVRVQVNLEAMRRWALQYALHIRVLSPDSLAQQMKQDLLEAMKNYGLSYKN